MNFRNALLSATLLALPVGASAQPITGLYIGAGAGVNVMLGENAQFARSPFAGNSKLDTHFGHRLPFGTLPEVVDATNPPSFELKSNNTAAFDKAGSIASVTATKNVRAKPLTEIRMAFLPTTKLV